jgi:uncharacterized protein YqeY
MVFYDIEHLLMGWIIGCIRVMILRGKNMSVTLQQLKDELKQAMLAKDVFKRDTLRPLIGDVQNALSQAKSLPEVEVIQGKLKSFTDSCHEVIAVLEQDITNAAEIEVKRAEVAVYALYRVVMEDIAVIRAAVVAKFGEVITAKDRGVVMGFIKQEFKGRFDGAQVNEMVVGLIAK